MEQVYCICGIGADARIFARLNIPGYQLVPVHWEPFSPGETMKSYAEKLSEQIPAEKPIVLGYSFGGMLATEMGKLRPTKKILLVSTAKASSELPWIGRTAYAGALVDVVPEWIFTQPGRFSFSLAGAQNAHELNLLASMMRDTPPGFIKNALKIVTEWKNFLYPGNIVQLHGTKDKVIPPSNVHPDYWIKGGSHIMIYNRAEEISRIIEGCLKGIA